MFYLDAHADAIHRFALVVEGIVSEPDKGLTRRQGRQALEVKGREKGTIVQIWKL